MKRVLIIMMMFVSLVVFGDTLVYSMKGLSSSRVEGYLDIIGTELGIEFVEGDVSELDLYVSSSATTHGGYVGYCEGRRIDLCLGKLSGYDLKNLLRHELGHYFGLGHSSTRYDVMYPVVESGVDCKYSDSQLAFISESRFSSPIIFVNDFANVDEKKVNDVEDVFVRSSCNNDWDLMIEHDSRIGNGIEYIVTPYEDIKYPEPVLYIVE